MCDLCECMSVHVVCVYVFVFVMCVCARDGVMCAYVCLMCDVWLVLYSNTDD